MSIRLLALLTIILILLPHSVAAQQQEEKEVWVIRTWFSGEGKLTPRDGLEFDSEIVANEHADGMRDTKGVDGKSIFSKVEVVPGFRSKDGAVTIREPVGPPAAPLAGGSGGGPKFKLPMPEKKWVDAKPYNPPDPDRKQAEKPNLVGTWRKQYSSGEAANRSDVIDTMVFRADNTGTWDRSATNRGQSYTDQVDFTWSADGDAFTLKYVRTGTGIIPIGVGTSSTYKLKSGEFSTTVDTPRSAR